MARVLKEMKMRNYDEFMLKISTILPLPKNNAFSSADGTTQVELTKAAKNIEAAIKKFKKKHDLKPEEILKLKKMAIKRFDKYRQAWNSKEAAS